MPDSRPWSDRLVESVLQSVLFKYFAGFVLVPFWAWWTPVSRRIGGAPSGPQPGENLQRMMNLVMPLKDKTALGRARAAAAIGENLDELFAGLDSVGTVHFARFVIVDNNLCMFSEYDGDFANYIRDFIVQMGSVFDEIVSLIEDGEKVLPTDRNIEAFISWVQDHDMYQLPDQPTELLTYGTVSCPGGQSGVDDDIRLLPRALILQLNVNRDVALGCGYRGYPGYSSAQIRRQMGMGR